MNVFTKRNALVGWLVMRIARRRVEQKLSSLVGRTPRRRALVAGGVGLVAAGVGTTVAVLARRDRPVGSTA